MDLLDKSGSIRVIQLVFPSTYHCKGPSKKFNVASKMKFIANGGEGVNRLVHRGAGMGGNLQKIIMNFLLLATLNFLDGP